MVKDGKANRREEPLSPEVLKTFDKTFQELIDKKGSRLFGYQTYSIQSGKVIKKPVSKQDYADVAEFLTFGLTNREYQELMESIDFVPKKQSVWSKFVKTIREYLGLPVKANTVLSGFLENAASLIDTASVFPTGFTIGERITEQSIGTLDESISKLNNRIFTLERRLQADRPYLPNSTIIKEQNQIGRLKAQLAQLEQERRNLPPEQPPLFSRSTRYATDSSSSKNKKLIEATERVEEIVKSTPNGEIPTVNPNASDIAFESFLEFNDVNNTQAAPDDIPSFSIGAIPDDFRDVEDKVGYIRT